MSPHAKALGFQTSWMEQLLKLPRYARRGIALNYDPRYTTQLTKNYRNHPQILELANELFYENMLEAMAPAGKNSFHI